MSISHFIFTGIILGLTAGISPGPLLTLVITQTLKHGKKEGIKVAMVPLFSDIPLILISIFILSRLSQVNMLLGIISIAGAIFLTFLAYESLTFKKLNIDVDKVKPQSFKKGIITNALNPAPFIFWLSVGGTLILAAYKVAPVAAFLFVGAFYACLVGSKIVAAIITEKSHAFLTSRGYIYTIKILGIVLLYFAFTFLRDGLSFLGVL